MFELSPNTHYFSEDHTAFRHALRAFVDKEITPNVPAWEDAGRMPREIFKKIGDMGVQGVICPTNLGGSNGDFFMQIVVSEELSRCGAGGVCASLGSHSIGNPPIVNHGSDDLKTRVAMPVIAGDKISALAITEPGGGSDVGALRTNAVRDGDHFIVNGEKTFITSGMQADFFTVAVRTDAQKAGHGGISFLMIEGDTPGLGRTQLKKMGWWASDTAHLTFDNCRVPVTNLIGQEGEGFKNAMMNFNAERLTIASQAYSFAEVCYREALAWAQDRQAFGKPLSQQQVIRHKLVDMAMKIDAAKTLTYDIVYRHIHKMDPLNVHIARTSMAKITATDTMQFCADAAVQILGGMGYMQGTASERIYRETKVLSIGGGTDEIMRNLASSQLGI
ncbi:acyl-CoA dehydrogenase family protein [Thalassovita taeanensis]|uniref:Acyl-CoA dehydrogenase n=1 Tax=Thalassovita taeanensis TaxID=657014 RepID=A0A1H9BB30_9RHOB|nr:acyl-CoA dehydrogenase family protein [Thalassovita taeanensis]SEP85901.1 acyl-CoA dehydrogenase [Thalassovita taeanensis]